MKIEQKKEFHPITITFETEEDATIFWELICYCSSKRQGKVKDMATTLSNWFSNNAQF